MGVLDGIEVLDLSWGISGPMTGMLLGDHGARVTKIEPPGGDPWEHRLSGYRVWGRNKRRAALDLHDAEDKRRFLALAATADVLVESFSPGTTARLGIDFATLTELNPRLIYCSITPYGPDRPDADRPGIDGLVAARTGHQWAIRGMKEGITARLSGIEGPLPELEAPPDCWVGPDRPGPLFSGVPWVSLAAFYLASVSINAALRAREHTGRGQLINTSLLQGVLATTLPWQAAEHADAPDYQTWIFDPRAPKGFFQAADGRWTHHWVQLPDFIFGAADSDGESGAGLPSPKTAGMRVAPSSNDMIVLHALQSPLAEAVAKYPARTWVRLAAEAGVPVQMVRSPEEALLDPLLFEDGCVIEVDDPDVGLIRQVGRVLELSRHPFQAPRPAARPGEHTDEVRADADAALARDEAAPSPSGGAALAAPLAGVVVLDLGLAVAGPFGTQVLAQLGARVIKVNTARDAYWMKNQIGIWCNRDKDSIILNLKDPEGLAVLYRLVERADVVAHNMRYAAAVRLGVDYESLQAIKPDVIYCHSLGHEQGPRQFHPGNDQTASALAGPEWLDGGLDNGGRPIWSNTSLGDTGTGFLSALGTIQALYDRDRTGSGQFVQTSIVYTHLLNASTAWISPDGSVAADRQRPDAEQYGWCSLYRLYETSDGWLCIAVLDEASWRALCTTIDRPGLVDDERFATPARRREHDEALAAELAQVFRSDPAAAWFGRLDAAGVPCEISDPDYPGRLFDDPSAERQGLVSTFGHPVLGTLKMHGLLFDLSDTPGIAARPGLVPGQQSRDILGELGYPVEEIEKLLATGAVGEPPG